MDEAERNKLVDSIIELALAEDMSRKDVTRLSLIPPELEGAAIALVKASGVLAGLEVAERVFLKVDPALRFDILIPDGSRIKHGDIVARVSGRVAGILTAERTALNFLQRLSGVASQTAEYVSRLGGLNVDIVDTRKTTPGLRYLEKYAVRMGGGKNHRLHLADGILIKDNHLVALRALGLSLKGIIDRAKKTAPPGLKVEVEVVNQKEVLEAIEAGADIIMLDNMSPEEMRRATGVIPSHIRVEASGGVNLANVREVAESGVDFISIGALTHSTKALDISLELEKETLRCP